MATILTRTMTYVFVIVICLLGVGVVTLSAWPEFSKMAPVSPVDAGLVLSKTFTAFALEEDAERYIAFGSDFKIYIEPKGSGKNSFLREYKMEVVAIKDGKEISEKFEKKIVSSIPQCDMQSCTFICNAMTIKSESGKVSVFCFGPDSEEVAPDATLNFCSVSGQSERIRAVVESSYEAAAFDAGINPELFKALVKGIMRTESSFSHCKNGVVLIGPAGSVGIMQINPKYHGSAFSLETNIRKGIAIFSDNLKYFKDYKEQIRLAVANYNCGAVRTKVLDDAGRDIAKGLSWELFKPHIKKYCSYNRGNTVEYVDKVMEAANYYAQHPSCYKYTCELIS